MEVYRKYIGGEAVLLKIWACLELQRGQENKRKKVKKYSKKWKGMKNVLTYEIQIIEREND